MHFNDRREVHHPNRNDANDVLRDVCFPLVPSLAVEQDAGVPVVLDHETCYRTVLGRDSRFDGCFVTAVSTTGIYCRPSCPATTPKRQNVSFLPTSAAAQQAGYRACKRCRPDASPGSPEWNMRGDLVGRAMRLIADGIVDRSGVHGLASHLGYSERHVTRVLTVELGVGPIALARAQRAQTARILIESTSLPFTDVTFAAGFSSIRQFNDTIRDVFASTPTALRASKSPQTTPGVLHLRLPFRGPFHATALLRYLSHRAVPGVEWCDRSTYRRVLRLPFGGATATLRPGVDHVSCSLVLDDMRDLTAAVERLRRLFDLDADPISIGESLSLDPALAPLVDYSPGLRAPGHVDGAELAVRAVLGQQVSVAAARTIAGRLTAMCGAPLAVPDPDGVLTHQFPSAAALAELDPALLPMPTSRRATLLTLCRHLADGSMTIDPGQDRAELSAKLTALPGIGPWTAGYIVMRAVSDPDVFLPTDLGVRHALVRLGLPGDPRSAAARSETWRPWRSYALAHLWNSLSPVEDPCIN